VNTPATSTSAALEPLLEGKVALLERTLARIAREHAPAALASSLGAEDMVLTDAILRTGLAVEIFTLDTGRLHPETLGLVEQVRERYGYLLRVWHPQPEAIAEYVSQFGLNAFYQSVELRQHCCHIRKVEPLNRALQGKRAWVTGLRRSQSATRSELPHEEFDREHGLLKFNPLCDWSESEVWSYLRARDVPYNALHDRGFRSIGCAPCTRALEPGEDLRAGRWWWEHAETKECGLHRRPQLDSPTRHA
jgi:phosphoadenosine phosphosulfate reductase